ncbi:MAG TPA: PhzF family phenazine biosynthesis protein [Polyangiaceae bacterium]|nr:PhzF family phenazine biosynthesis protein [Polyangiaceae bacterium]
MVELAPPSMSNPSRPGDPGDPVPASSRRGFQEYAYRSIDVFAERPFTGAPLAVFTDARGLDATAMKTIARELNRAQTAFLFPDESTDGVPRMRVFTPLGEVPAGHYPSIGAAFALSLERGGQATPALRVVFQGDSGPVSVSTFARVMTVRQPAPALGAVYADTDAALATLGLREDQRMAGVPFQAAAGGVSYLVMALRNRAALRSIRFRQDIWERTIRHFEAPRIAAFTLETDRAGSTAKVRVFSPDIGVEEEPATETVCGPLTAFLCRYGFLAAESPQMLVLEQGAEVGRPSFLHVAIERDADSVTSVRVGGQCVAVGEGKILAQVTLP